VLAYIPLIAIWLTFFVNLVVVATRRSWPSDSSVVASGAYRSAPTEPRWRDGARLA
jgi:hypothetical protein